MSETLDPKDPLENKFYTFDLESWLDAMGTTISSLIGVAVIEGTCTIGSSAATTTVINYLLQGGADGERNRIRARFQTADGQSLVSTMEVWVLQK